ncbi:MAG: response regulator [Candidatus Aminicenantes bacterium]|nr:response regulator [Candidatus Aminicenantes bacterium]
MHIFWFICERKINKKNLILIVDDEEEIRLLLKEFLEKNNFDVIVAEDGQQALKLAGEHIPDLVITDMLLPKEHGVYVMQAIKDRHFLPIIAISGIYNKNEIIDKVDDVYIDGFFEKPLNLDEILLCIHSILNG